VARDGGVSVVAARLRRRRGPGPSGALGRAPERRVDVLLEQPQALEAGNRRDRRVDPAGVFAALLGVAEQIQRERVDLLLALDPGADRRPQGLQSPPNDAPGGARALQAGLR
jgi:hypothetical protein